MSWIRSVSSLSSWNGLVLLTNGREQRRCPQPRHGEKSTFQYRLDRENHCRYFLYVGCWIRFAFALTLLVCVRGWDLLFYETNGCIVSFFDRCLGWQKSRKCLWNDAYDNCSKWIFFIKMICDSLIIALYMVIHIQFNSIHNIYPLRFG